VLDLAICWVCGEVVFCGEECVNLGWCFWHRGCFGCLFCGGKELAQEVLPEVGGVEDGIWFGSGKGWRIEIEVMPLCEPCLVEVEGEGGHAALDKAAVAEMAVARVGSVDGRLARERWERRKGDAPGKVRPK
jgi:hypothetical protein